MSAKARKVETDEPGFDSAVGGGLPPGGLIVLAGNPGLGKTLFSARFLTGGAAKGERGIYASFAEGREALHTYLSSVGYDFKDLERAGKLRTLDFVTMKEEAISEVMQVILSEVSRFKAKRLVIDSFSAMAQAFAKATDARIVLHTVVSKIIRLMGCTTVLVVETPIGDERIGWGVEEFVADAIIQFRRGEMDGRMYRAFTVLKLRGSEVAHPNHVFTLSGGFHAFSQNKMRVPEKLKPWRPVPDQGGCISTGNKGLDSILRGAVLPGSLVTIEAGMDVPFAAWSSVVISHYVNFVSHGRGMFIIPSMQATATSVTPLILPLLGEEYFYKYCRMGEYRPVKDEEVKLHQVLLKGESIVNDFEEIIRATDDLGKATGRETLTYIAMDTIEYTYGPSEILKVLGRWMTGIRASKNLASILIRPGLSVIPQIRSISDVYLKLADIEGVVVLYGIKPRTELFELQEDNEMGYPAYKLTPIV